MNCDVCGDNRYELIDKAKKRLIEATNIEDRPEEMAVLDSILLRFWQMGWLDPAGKIISLRETVSECREQNEKLRKLIQRTWVWEKSGCYECPLEKDCKVLCVYDGDCGMAVEIEKELQELGIEVY